MEIPEYIKNRATKLVNDAVEKGWKMKVRRTDYGVAIFGLGGMLVCNCPNDTSAAFVIAAFDMADCFNSIADDVLSRRQDKKES